MSENQDSLSAQISEKASEVAAWRRLMEYPQFGMLSEAMEEQIKQRSGVVLLQPLESMDKALAQEFMKGEVAGLTLAKGLAQTLMEAAEIDLQRLNNDIKEMTNEQTTPKTSRPGVDGPSWG